MAFKTRKTRANATDHLRSLLAFPSSSMRILVLFAALFSVVHAITIPNLLGSTNLDTCAYINSELVVPDLQVGPGILIAVGLIGTSLEILTTAQRS